MKLKFIFIGFVILLNFASAIGATDSDIDKALALIKSGNFVQALPILVPLADEGDVEAMIALGYYYLFEKENQSKSLGWFRKAVLTGNPQAQLHLGLVLAEILGGNDNFSEGVEWLKKSAFQGNKTAATKLAAYYYTGRSTINKDMILSEWWRNRAKNN